jgi:hypothetical protein
VARSGSILGMWTSVKPSQECPLYIGLAEKNFRLCAPDPSRTSSAQDDGSVWEVGAFVYRATSALVGSGLAGGTSVLVLHAGSFTDLRPLRMTDEFGSVVQSYRATSALVGIDLAGEVRVVVLRAGSFADFVRSG